jgi:hypothetical protein
LSNDKEVRRMGNKIGEGGCGADVEKLIGLVEDHVGDGAEVDVNLGDKIERMVESGDDPLPYACWWMVKQ